MQLPQAKPIHLVWPWEDMCMLLMTTNAKNIKTVENSAEHKLHNGPNVWWYVSAIQLISRGPVPMSGAGTSIPGPKYNAHTRHQ